MRPRLARRERDGEPEPQRGAGTAGAARGCAAARLRSAPTPLTELTASTAAPELAAPARRRRRRAAATHASATPFEREPRRSPRRPPPRRAGVAPAAVPLRRPLAPCAAAAARPGRRARDARPRAEEPPPVRVHIGRLEVRANVAASRAARSEPRAASRRAAGAASSLGRTTCAGSGRRAMSTPLAIGAVSAVLRNLLDNGLVDVGAPLGPVNVTAVAPDRIDLDDAEAPPSLNLFLYRTSQPGLGRGRACRPSTATARALAPAARARPPLPAHRVRRRRLPGRDPARLRDAPPARAAGARPRRDPRVAKLAELLGVPPSHALASADEG